MPKNFGDISFGMEIDGGEAVKLKEDESEFEVFTPADMTMLEGVPVILKGGVKQVGAKMAVIKGTTTSGVFTMYLTHDGTSGGTPLFTEILHLNIQVNDNTNVYLPGYSIAGDMKSASININRQTSTGATILSIGVLTALNNVSASNGTNVSILVIGK